MGFGRRKTETPTAPPYRYQDSFCYTNLPEDSEEAKELRLIEDRITLLSKNWHKQGLDHEMHFTVVFLNQNGEQNG